MFQYDFSNHQNRHIRIMDMPAEYFQRIQETTRNDPYYPVWHIAPKCGLMNDPNGLCEINGIHHIFYQWFPTGPVHGLKHWYHLTTKDFIHYEDHGVAMYPDTESDSFGCYTGMALKEGEQVQVFYTGIENEEMIPCTCYARFDGEKLTDRKKIVEMDPNQTTMNYRDPYVWKRDSEYWMLTGAESKEHEGILMLYRGKQADSYEYAGRVRLLQNGQEAMLGYMLECPNYYEENQKGVLFCSPMGISSENKYDYKNVFSVVYMIGKPLDTERKEFQFSEMYELDKGFDFYAPQSYEDEKHRRILFGWLGNSKSEYPTDKNNWAHMLTLPREIWIEKDRLIQQPVEELNQLRANERSIAEHIKVEECSFELEGNTEGAFSIEIGNKDGNCLILSADGEEYCLDRSGMTEVYAEKFGTIRYAKQLEKKQTVRVMVDHSSIEIFCDHGKTVFTSRMFIDHVSYVKVKNLSGKFYDLKK